MDEITMTTKLKAITTYANDELVKRVDSFWHAKSFMNRSKTVEYLLAYALDRLEKEEGPGIQKQD